MGPGATNNLEHFRTEEFQIICTRKRVQLDLEGQKSRTDTSFGNDTDVNNIVARFARTGEMTHVNQQQPHYADVTAMQGDLTEIIEKGKNARKALTDIENANQAKLKAAAEENAKQAEADKKRLAELEARYQSEGAGDS